MAVWTDGLSGMNFIKDKGPWQIRLLSLGSRILFLTVFMGIFFSWSHAVSADAVTVTPQYLNFSGPLNDQNAEVSGLTWNDETLVILPQNPARFGEGGYLGFFIMEKEDLLKAVRGESKEAIIPGLIKCYAPGLMGIIRGFDGLEAMGIKSGRCFITVEAKGDSTMAGYLLCGDYDYTSDVVHLDMNRLTSIPLGLNIPNIAEESMIIDGDRVITFSEANGREVCANPKAKVFDRDVNYLGSLPFPNIEYRVTDATGLDESGCFWVINYSYPPERQKLKVAADPELEKYGPPTDGQKSECVERLLELQLTADDRIVRTETPPIYLARCPDGKCRNWEGLVRLDDGFLLMTDRYPGTLLAYVSNPYAQAK